MASKIVISWDLNFKLLLVVDEYLSYLNKNSQVSVKINACELLLIDNVIVVDHLTKME